MAQGSAIDDGDDGLAAVVRRLGSLERQVDQFGQRLAALETSIDGLTKVVGAQLPRLQREVVAAAAMVDAVAAQVAADTDAMGRRLDRIDPGEGVGPAGGDARPRGEGGFWRGLLGRSTTPDEPGSRHR